MNKTVQVIRVDDIYFKGKMNSNQILYTSTPSPFNNSDYTYSNSSESEQIFNILYLKIHQLTLHINFFMNLPLWVWAFLLIAIVFINSVTPKLQSLFNNPGFACIRYYFMYIII